LDCREIYVSFVIPIHTSTIAETLVKIGLVVGEIFGEIDRFLPSHPKRCICYPYNLWGYWTNFHHICIECSWYIGTEYFWIGMAILQAVFKRRSAKQTHIGLPKFCHKIGCHGNIPWGIRIRGPDRSYSRKYLSFWKMVKNRSSGSWDNYSPIKSL